MRADPKHFAEIWLEAWNNRDLDTVLSLFAEDAVFTSPFANKILPESGGRLTGKAEIRAYWSLGLQQVPDLQFTLEEVFAGVDAMVILYHNQKGARVSEILKFAGDEVIEGHGTYTLD